MGKWAGSVLGGVMMLGGDLGLGGQLLLGDLKSGGDLFKTPEAPNMQQNAIGIDQASIDAADAERRRRSQTSVTRAARISEALASTTAKTNLGGTR